MNEHDLQEFDLPVLSPRRDLVVAALRHRKSPSTGRWPVYAAALTFALLIVAVTFIYGIPRSAPSPAAFEGVSASELKQRANYLDKRLDRWASRPASMRHRPDALSGRIQRLENKIEAFSSAMTESRPARPSALKPRTINKKG